MQIPEALQLAIKGLEELLGNSRIRLQSLRQKLTPWAEQKNIKIYTSRNHFYITWSQGRALGMYQPETRSAENLPVTLTFEQAKGVLDHVAIMAINMATLPETNHKDQTTLIAIGNLASAITEELTHLEVDSSGISQETFLTQLQEPLKGIGLRLTVKKKESVTSPLA